MALNKALREMEVRLAGAAAGRPPLPPAARDSRPAQQAPEPRRAGLPEAPKREVRRPSASKGTGSLGVSKTMEPGKGSTWMDWEPKRDAAREDASFTNDELFKIRCDFVLLL